MITGFNTDVPFQGKVYHVQTEDKGVDNPTIESLIYVGGEILAAFRTSYSNLVRHGRCDEKKVTRLLEAQHHRLIREIRQGRHDPDGLKPIGEGLITDRSLDQVVLDYIGELLKEEKLELTPLSEDGLEGGGTCHLQLLARGNLTGRPIRNANVVFQLERETGIQEVLFKEKTGTDGIVRVRFPIPAVEDDRGLLVALLDHEACKARCEWKLGSHRESGKR